MKAEWFGKDRATLMSKSEEVLKSRRHSILVPKAVPESPRSQCWLSII